VTPPLLLISDGLIKHQDGLTLHPDLFLWQRLLQKRKAQWFSCAAYNPLAVYARLLQQREAALLSEKLNIRSGQCWVASPYHARMGRDAIRVMPEGQMSWSQEDASWLCSLFNPLLAEEGMQLHAIHAALLLHCATPLQVSPVGFADIAGCQLPNRHPDGKDGGQFMRLMSEIQMVLNQQPAPHRRQRADLDIHGLWFWGASEAEDQPKKEGKHFAIATRNPYLQSIVNGQNARMIITEAARASELLRQDDSLPKHVCLMGEGHALWLEKRWFSLFAQHKIVWTPQNLASEESYFQRLRACCD